MRVNCGFPELYPVLEGILADRMLGETYQRLINCTKKGSGHGSDTLVVAPAAPANETEMNRRNELLYVVIGDPALRLIAP